MIQCRRLIFWLLLAGANVALAADASPFEQRFAEAQARFVAAKAKLAQEGSDPLEARRAFREAAELFAAIGEDGAASANLYVNAGNAFHFAGDEPRALLWYLRAAELANRPEIRAGLATLRRLCKTDPWPPPRASIGRVLMFWHYDLGGRLKQGLFMALYPAGCVLMMVGLFVRWKRRLLRAGLVLMIVGGAFGVSDAVAAAARGEEWAVVVEQTKGLAGDGQMYSTAVESIAAGQEVRQLESRREWVQVELPSGKRCWLPTNVCMSTSPPRLTLAGPRR